MSDATKPRNTRPLVVVALGGNALLRRGEPLDACAQRRNVEHAAAAIAELAAGHRVVVTHGNGPQVGLLALQSEACAEAPAYPLDVLGAESEGMIGYMLEQALHGKLGEASSCTLLTEVLVDPEDPAFTAPSKPIGPVYDHSTAHRLASERGWAIAPDGEHWRRVVPSPEPLEIVELSTIEVLVEAGVLVICTGGGGVPVVAEDGGGLRGVEAVIDKDLAAALLARELGADALLLLTDVGGVERNHGTPVAHPIRDVYASELDPQEFEAGTMRPKITAARRFAEETGRPAMIGALGEAAAVLAGSAGTRVRGESVPAGELSEGRVSHLRDRARQLGEDAALTDRLARRAGRPALGMRPPWRRPGA